MIVDKRKKKKKNFKRNITPDLHVSFPFFFQRVFIFNDGFIHLRGVCGITFVVFVSRFIRRGILILFSLQRTDTARAYTRTRTCEHVGQLSAKNMLFRRVPYLQRDLKQHDIHTALTKIDKEKRPVNIDP